MSVGVGWKKVGRVLGAESQEDSEAEALCEAVRGTGVSPKPCQGLGMTKSHNQKTGPRQHTKTVKMDEFYVRY